MKQRSLRQKLEQRKDIIVLIFLERSKECNYDEKKERKKQRNKQTNKQTNRQQGNNKQQTDETETESIIQQCMFTDLDIARMPEEWQKQ